jgi:hypothetical protein
MLSAVAQHIGFPNGKSVIESNFQQLHIAPVESQWRVGYSQMFIPFPVLLWNEKKTRNESGAATNRPQAQLNEIGPTSFAIYGPLRFSLNTGGVARRGRCCYLFLPAFYSFHFFCFYLLDGFVEGNNNNNKQQTLIVKNDD